MKKPEVLNMNEYSKYTINSKETIRNIFKKMDLNKRKFITMIDDEEKMVGIVTDGDLRRAIWSNVSLEDIGESIMNEDFIYFTRGNYNLTEIEKIFLEGKIKQIPILEDGRMIDVVFPDNTQLNSRIEFPDLSIPVVIMAGGFGSRLDPFTRVLPKPLIPIGEKPVIEIIMDRFVDYGVNEFYISVNHKARMVKAFFEEFGQKYNISYIEEEKPLGTAGSLKFLENKIETPFIVSNCDIIIEEDYGEIYEFHKNGGYDLTLVASMQHHVVPYGICDVQSGGELGGFQEKPKYDFLVNTGMYILNPEALENIPLNKKFHITELIEKLKANSRKVGVYPISEKSWIDIGQWEEYKNMIDKFEIPR